MTFEIVETFAAATHIAKFENAEGKEPVIVVLKKGHAGFFTPIGLTPELYAEIIDMLLAAEANGTFYLLQT